MSWPDRVFHFCGRRRLFDIAEEGPRVGFWAALSWLTLPGVAVSTGFMTTEPALLACWALALYGLVRAMQDGGILWWAVHGAALGLGFLAHPVIIAFPIGALGYALFSRAREEGETATAGAVTAAIAAVLVAAPNIAWLVEAGALPSLDRKDWSLRPVEFAGFVLGQFAILGPILCAALLILVLRSVEWHLDWRLRLLLWLSIPLIGFIAVKSLVLGSDLHEAGPAFIAVCLAVSALFVRRNFSKLLQISVAASLGIWVGYWSIASLYDTRHSVLPRAPDPFKKLRSYQPICGASLAAMDSTEDAAVLADDRNLLAVCMYEGQIGPERAVLWDPGDRRLPSAAPALQEGDPRRFVYVTVKDGADAVTARFDTAERIAQVPVRSHRDRAYVVSVWALEGFLGYGTP